MSVRILSISLLIVTIVVASGCVKNPAQAGAAKSSIEIEWHDSSSGSQQYGSLGITGSFVVSGHHGNPKNRETFKIGFILDNKGVAPCQIFGAAKDGKLASTINKDDDVDLHIELLKGITLSDESGNNYKIIERVVGAPTGSADDWDIQSARLSLKPGESFLVGLSFTCPKRNPKVLRLTMPGEQFGQTTGLSVIIPARFIVVGP